MHTYNWEFSFKKKIQISKTIQIEIINESNSVKIIFTWYVASSENLDNILE